MKTLERAILSLALPLLFCACKGSVHIGGDDDSGDDAPGMPDAGPEVPACDTAGRPYIGFGGNDLGAGRAAIDPGGDRLRLKPTTALAGEYQRVLGVTVNVADYNATLGRPPARWAAEPTPSADSMFALYTLAYQGCLDYTADGADYAEAPTAATAQAICAGFAAQFWNRAATAEEVAACVSVAVDATAAEANPRRRWAHTCAAVLTSAGFLAY